MNLLMSELYFNSELVGSWADAARAGRRGV